MSEPIADRWLEPANRLTLHGAAGAIRAGRITARRVVESCLSRIAARDPQVRAFARLNPAALDDADRRDREAPRGPLHGVPIAIKDLIDTEGLGTECGTPVLAGRIPNRDAACVARLKAAGAIVIGKTASTELAHVTPAATANPHDLGRTPGGSSSGSAAAVADFMVPGALGTQTGGSVIRPASFCGVFGFKSSCGRTELAGVHELAGSLDTIGWMARGADDLALLGAILLQPQRSGARPVRPCIGLARTPYNGVASEATHRATREAAAMLIPHADVVEISLPADFRELNDLHRRICSTEAALAFAAYARLRPDLLSPDLTAFIAEGKQNRSVYAEAMATARAYRATLSKVMQGFDALLVPAAPDEAPTGLDNTGDASFNLFWSLLQVPCTTIPFASGDHGLPIGIQLVGAFNRDEELLALTTWVAKRLNLE